jgi:hypothetical protein
MPRDGGGFTTDLRTLAATHAALGLGPICDGLAAREAVELLLVTAPRWLDLDADAPEHVVHAGRLDVRTQAGAAQPAAGSGQRVLLTFSTTVMEGQLALVDRVCAPWLIWTCTQSSRSGPRSIATRSTFPTGSRCSNSATTIA